MNGFRYIEFVFDKITTSSMCIKKIRPPAVRRFMLQRAIARGPWFVYWQALQLKLGAWPLSLEGGPRIWCFSRFVQWPEFQKVAEDRTNLGLCVFIPSAGCVKLAGSMPPIYKVIGSLNLA